MANQTDPTNDGWSLDLSDFIAENGWSIKWGRVGVSIIGAGLLAWFQGFASIFVAATDFGISLFTGLADFTAAVVTIVAGLPAVMVERGFAAAIPFVLDAGIAGYAVAVSIALASLYVFSRVLNRVT